ncbi:MAG TPA: thioredoxin family protein [Kofleriaceae bacterium]
MTRAVSVAVAAGLAFAPACGSTPAPAAPASGTTSPASKAPKAPQKIVQLNDPGAPVDVAAALPAGYVTVVDFWGVACEACVTFGRMLETGVAGEPRVVIRKIDVGDGDTPVAEAYKIAVLPHFFIYDKQKRLRYDLVGPDCKDATKFALELAAE